jgi:hypothetical protein
MAPQTALPARPQAPVTPQPAGGPVLTRTDPNNALTSQTITPGAGVDRVALAADRFKTFTASTAPAYQAALRDANRMGAAAGGLGSGQLRTSFGDLGLARTNQLQTASDTLQQNALDGSIEDGWRGIGLAERQQGFQRGQQGDAFQEALARWNAGNMGGTGSSSQAAYGANVAGQGQDALSALNTYARNGASAPTPTAPPKLPTNIDWNSIAGWL